ncbi:hypothetical protein [Specibacter sp. RAF43]|uniref:hypothetical protein n=1 Tax=Specibacter sp. RAF43 TaxID=3233057 RepID=UPI003F99F5D7
MRWEALFGDLEAQLHAATQQDLEREVNELARMELAQSTFADALRGARDRDITAVVANGVVHHGRVRRVESQWALLRTGNRSVVLPLAKILRVQGTGPERVPRPGHSVYTFAAALRILARNRAAVVLDLDSPQPSRVRGVLDQVGADCVVVAQLADGVGRGRDNLQGSVLVPFTAILSATSAADNEL